MLHYVNSFRFHYQNWWRHDEAGIDGQRYGRGSGTSARARRIALM